MTTTAEHAQDAASPATAESCEAIRELLGYEGLCQQPAIGKFRRICVHEHIRDGWLCADHAGNSQYGLCRACHDLPGRWSHECPIAMTEVTA